MEKSPNDPLPAVQASEQRQGRQAEAERPSSARHNVLADMHAYKCRVAGNEAGGLLEEPIRKGSPTMKEPDRRSSAKSLSARVGIKVPTQIKGVTLTLSLVSSVTMSFGPRSSIYKDGTSAQIGGWVDLDLESSHMHWLVRYFCS